MKKLKVIDKTACMACRACEVACSEAFYKKEDYSPDLSCIHIVDKGDNTPKIMTCVQCGKCAKACEQGAITKNAKGVYTIDKKKCIGCGKCAEACPFNLIVFQPGMEKASKCIACGICAKACPQGILEVMVKED